MTILSFKMFHNTAKLAVFMPRCKFYQPQHQKHPPPSSVQLFENYAFLIGYGTGTGFAWLER